MLHEANLLITCLKHSFKNVINECYYLYQAYGDSDCCRSGCCLASCTRYSSKNPNPLFKASVLTNRNRSFMDIKFKVGVIHGRIFFGVMETDNLHTGQSLQLINCGSSRFKRSSELCYQTTQSLQNLTYGFHLTKDHFLYLHTIKDRFNPSYGF